MFINISNIFQKLFNSSKYFNKFDKSLVFHQKPIKVEIDRYYCDIKDKIMMLLGEILIMRNGTQEFHSSIIIKYAPTADENNQMDFPVIKVFFFIARNNKTIELNMRPDEIDTFEDFLKSSIEFINLQNLGDILH